jgi:hypothetical protein
MKLLNRDELIDLALSVRNNETVLTEEDVSSERVFLIISSLRSALKEPNNGLILRASKILAKHIAQINVIDEARRFPPDVR